MTYAPFLRSGGILVLVDAVLWAHQFEETKSKETKVLLLKLLTESIIDEEKWLFLAQHFNHHSRGDGEKIIAILSSKPSPTDACNIISGSEEGTASDYKHPKKFHRRENV